MAICAELLQGEYIWNKHKIDVCVDENVVEQGGKRYFDTCKYIFFSVSKTVICVNLCIHQHESNINIKLCREMCVMNV